MLLTGSGSPLAVGRGEDAVQFGTAVAQEPEGGALATHGTEVERRHEDSLVPPATQGVPLYEAWRAAASPGSTYLELPPGAGHNLEAEIDIAALESWLEQVVARSF